MVAVIAGSTGLVGHLVLTKLLDSVGIQKVISISRRPTGITHSKFQEVIFEDLSRLGEIEQDLKGDVYICCLGTTIKVAGSQDNFKKIDFAAVRDFGKIALTHKATSFVVVSAMGADSQSSIFYNRVKGETEKALREMGLRSLVIFRPGLLMGDRKEQRSGEKFFIHTMQFLKPLLPIAVEKRIATSVEQLADRIIEQGLKAPSGIHFIEAKDI